MNADTNGTRWRMECDAGNARVGAAVERLLPRGTARIAKRGRLGARQNSGASGVMIAVPPAMRPPQVWLLIALAAAATAVWLATKPATETAKARRAAKRRGRGRAPP